MTTAELLKEVLQGVLLIVGEYRGFRAEMAGYVDKKYRTAIQYVRVLAARMMKNLRLGAGPVAYLTWPAVTICGFRARPNGQEEVPALIVTWSAEFGELRLHTRAKLVP